MPLAPINPARFVDKQFVLRRTWPDRDNDFVPMIDDLGAGRIWLQQKSGNDTVWCTSLGSPALPTPPQPTSRDFPTLAAAKAGFRADFNAWLAAAMKADQVRWYVPAAFVNR